MAQVPRQFIQVQARNQFAYSLGSHTRAEDAAKAIFQFAVTVLLEQVHFLQPLQVTPQLL